MTSLVSLSVTPQELFREKITEASAQQNVSLSDEVEFYLVNLLCDFVDPSKTSLANEPSDLFEAPLALLMKDALEAEGERQYRIFKNLGDRSLYVAGYFQEYFNRKTYDVDYYVALGANAYNNLYSISRETKGSYTQVFQELSDNFFSLVELVATVSDSLMGRRTKDLLATYERWSRTSSDRLRRRLEEEGIFPVVVDMKIAQ